jgi:hypothetical protein
MVTVTTPLLLKHFQTTMTTATTTMMTSNDSNDGLSKRKYM